jgi:hypothetical protein
MPFIKKGTLFDFSDHSGDQLMAIATGVSLAGLPIVGVAVGGAWALSGAYRGMRAYMRRPRPIRVIPSRPVVTPTSQPAVQSPPPKSTLCRQARAAQARAAYDDDIRIAELLPDEKTRLAAKAQAESKLRLRLAEILEESPTA